MPEHRPAARTTVTSVPACPCPNEFVERHHGRHQPGCAQGPTATARQRPPKRMVPKEVAEELAASWCSPALIEDVAALVTGRQAAALAALLSALGRAEAAGQWLACNRAGRSDESAR